MSIEAQIQTLREDIANENPVHRRRSGNDATVSGNLPTASTITPQRRLPPHERESEQNLRYDQSQRFAREGTQEREQEQRQYANEESRQHLRSNAAPPQASDPSRSHANGARMQGQYVDARVEGGRDDTALNAATARDRVSIPPPQQLHQVFDHAPPAEHLASRRHVPYSANSNAVINAAAVSGAGAPGRTNIANVDLQSVHEPAPRPNHYACPVSLPVHAPHTTQSTQKEAANGTATVGASTVPTNASNNAFQSTPSSKPPPRGRLAKITAAATALRLKERRERENPRSATNDPTLVDPSDIPVGPREAAVAAERISPNATPYALNNGSPEGRLPNAVVVTNTGVAYDTANPDPNGGGNEGRQAPAKPAASLKKRIIAIFIAVVFTALVVMLMIFSKKTLFKKLKRLMRRGASRHGTDAGTPNPGGLGGRTSAGTGASGGAAVGGAAIPPAPSTAPAPTSASLIGANGATARSQQVAHSQSSLVNGSSILPLASQLDPYSQRVPAVGEYQPRSEVTGDHEAPGAVHPSRSVVNQNVQEERARIREANAQHQAQLRAEAAELMQLQALQAFQQQQHQQRMMAEQERAMHQRQIQSALANEAAMRAEETQARLAYERHQTELASGAGPSRSDLGPFGERYRNGASDGSSATGKNFGRGNRVDGDGDGDDDDNNGYDEYDDEENDGVNGNNDDNSRTGNNNSNQNGTHLGHANGRTNYQTNVREFDSIRRSYPNHQDADEYDPAPLPPQTRAMIDASRVHGISKRAATATAPAMAATLANEASLATRSGSIAPSAAFHSHAPINNNHAIGGGGGGNGGNNISNGVTEDSSNDNDNDNRKEAGLTQSRSDQHTASAVAPGLLPPHRHALSAQTQLYHQQQQQQYQQQAQQHQIQVDTPVGSVSMTPSVEPARSSTLPATRDQNIDNTDNTHDMDALLEPAPSPWRTRNFQLIQV